MKNVSRRAARIFALQLLYAAEITKQPVGSCLESVLANIREANGKELSAEMKRYGMSVVDLILEHRTELDSEISNRLKDWDFGRLALLDKIILYIALTELQYEIDVPVRVAIREAVQIADKYSTEKSYQFVNGILHQFAKDKGMFSRNVSEENQ